MLSGNELHYLSFFSLPEVKWLLTNPKEVPLNINDTPTAPLFPKGREKEKVSTTGNLGKWWEIKVEQCYSSGGEQEKQNSFRSGRLSGGRDSGEGAFLQDQKKIRRMASGLGSPQGAGGKRPLSKSSC